MAEMSTQKPITARRFHTRVAAALRTVASSFCTSSEEEMTLREGVGWGRKRF